MSAAGQILYLKIEQNCIVYKRSVTLQDIASVECTDVGILRQVLQEQVYYFSGNEKSSLVQVFSVLDVIRKIHEKYPMLEVENIGEPDFVIRYVPDPEKKIRAIFKDSVGLRDSVFRFRIYHHDIYRGCFCQ
ncbi:stage V sporulation protein AA [Eubacterium ramulus]|uniref:stage V sporulation protein AA n=1 Tax=Eubacterium ramulus TaxID=39490 RepID=UPI0039946126